MYLISERWAAGAKVTLATLTDGHLFVAIDGTEWERVRPDGALSGVVHCARVDRNGWDVFCASALVVPMEEQ